MPEMTPLLYGMRKPDRLAGQTTAQELTMELSSDKAVRQLRGGD